MVTKTAKTHEKETEAFVRLFFVPSRIFREQTFPAPSSEIRFSACAAEMVPGECTTLALARGALAVQDGRERVHAAADAG